MELSAKFKETLYCRIRATLKKLQIKVVLNPLYNFFLTLQKVPSWPSDQFQAIKNGGHRVCFLDMSN